MLTSLLTLATLLFTPAAVRASPCVAMDATWNLLAFGLDGKDWSAGTQDQWASGTATDITTSGRPPFDGTNTTCFLSQFTNAIYVTNGDKSNPSNVHIYNAAAKSWSTQSVTTGSFSPSSFNAILDHDTNEFYAVSNGELFRLDMGSLTAANSSALSWVDVEKVPYPSGYQPVMALANNHIHFLDVPGTPTGDANIYVIHFDFFQPDPQAYPTSSGGTFPATHGQTASFFLSSGVQQEFAFIPDDGSATYVINVISNTTQTLAGPSTKDPHATYFAGISSLVQLDSTGAVTFLPYNANDTSANTQASWSKVASLASAAPPGANSSQSSSSGSSTGTAKPSGSSSPSSGQHSGAIAVYVPRGLIGGIVGAVLLCAAAMLL